MQKNIKTREPGPSLQRLGRTTKSASSLLTENIRQEILFVKVERIIPFKAQARAYFPDDEIEAMAKTILEHGVRQPLTIIPSKLQASFYEVVSGERRLRAAKLAGLEKVPAILIHDEDKAEEIALIENVQRKDLHPIELGRAYRRLFESGLYRSQTELAEKLGIPRTQISEYVQFTNLSAQVIDQILRHNLSRRAFLRTLNGCKTEDDALRMLKREIEQEVGMEKKAPGEDGAEVGRNVIERNIKLVNFSLKGGALNIDDRNLGQCPKDVLTSLKEAFSGMISRIENMENSLNN